MKSWGMDGHISYTQPLGDNDKYLIVRANYTQSMNKITNFEEDLKKYDYQSDRVGQGHYCPLPPSEPYVRVSPHTAQAFQSLCSCAETGSSYFLFPLFFTG